MAQCLGYMALPVLRRAVSMRTELVQCIPLSMDGEGKHSDVMALPMPMASRWLIFHPCGPPALGCPRSASAHLLRAGRPQAVSQAAAGGNSSNAGGQPAQSGGRRVFPNPQPLKSHCLTLSPAHIATADARPRIERMPPRNPSMGSHRAIGQSNGKCRHPNAGNCHRASTLA